MRARVITELLHFTYSKQQVETYTISWMTWKTISTLRKSKCVCHECAIKDNATLSLLCIVNYIDDYCCFNEIHSESVIVSNSPSLAREPGVRLQTP